MNENEQELNNQVEANNYAFPLSDESLDRDCLAAAFSSSVRLY
jgi:hypothetical protein